ncbi:hypothetical protein [Phytohabitans rumicis]|uniref:Uncharacterized protein n=1 Tax=Phytohabitans rumicis TaxID=1076125 RepID=A0A6V8L802_9ACTN|nr:hypothetical protein [Phytohabitans rumicis]GFJ90256.1 hypothetical protein Prum_038980 [Phytohabitans rumicis]
MTQPPLSPWAPPPPPPPEPGETDTAVIPAVQPDEPVTAAIQRPVDADTAALPQVTARGFAQSPTPFPPPSSVAPLEAPTQPLATTPPPLTPAALALLAAAPSAGPPPAPPPPTPSPPVPLPAPAAGPPLWTAAPPGPPPLAPPAVPPPGLVVQPAAVHAPTAPKGWWRRNLWGLLALVPVLALAMGPGVKEGLDVYNRVDFHEAVNPGADGWVSYSDARIKLAELAPTTDVKTYGGEPFPVPAGTRVWRATITFEASTTKAVGGCTLALEDKDGRMFGPNPDELDGARVGFPACTPEDDNAPSPWQTVTYFVLPESATPAAVWVSRATSMPRYARLPA